eukprot:TRINITY_DN37663_c0_g1_i1.p1 TRINITY_DN37663_c0_g1~~TRINITY_DN37663_c0_g1_i1.p1  ORF type:complete len:494 (+),score=65.84 TRINITY_DN37663_c0_g1_i1:82-1563(+)
MATQNRLSRQDLLVPELSFAVPGDQWCLQLDNVKTDFADSGSDSSTWLRDIALECGVDESDFKSWSGSKSMAIGSPGHLAAMEVACRKIKFEFGEEGFIIFQSLHDVFVTLSKTISLSKSKFDLGLALPLLHFHHDTVGPMAKGRQIEDIELLRSFKQWLLFAAGAKCSADPHLAEDDTVNVKKAIFEQADVRTAWTPRSTDPSHYVAVHKESNSVVLGVGGTASPHDTLIKASGKPIEIDEFPGLWVHAGIMEIARNVISRVHASLEACFLQHDGFDLVVTGHSLWGGVAILSALLLTVKPLSTAPKVRCFAYGPPPVVAPLHAAVLQRLEIHALVNRDDLVPRFSMANVYRLAKETLAIDRTSLTLGQRLKLIGGAYRAIPASANAFKSDVIVAVQEERARRVTHEVELLASLFVPGRVYWIDIVKSVDEVTTRMYQIHSNQLQDILLKVGGVGSTDHTCASYINAVNLAIAAVANKHAMCCHAEPECNLM